MNSAGIGNKSITLRVMYLLIHALTSMIVLAKLSLMLESPVPSLTNLHKSSHAIVIQQIGIVRGRRVGTRIVPFLLIGSFFHCETALRFPVIMIHRFIFG